MESILNLIPAVMGLGVIDENLDSLLTAFNGWNAADITGTVMTWAKCIGACIALGVGANECIQMILGKRGMDVLKILHIIIISICISTSSYIVSALAAPGLELENLAKSRVNGMLSNLDEKQKNIVNLQKKYIDKVREVMAKMENNIDATKDKGVWDKMGEFVGVDNLSLKIENQFKDWALAAETTVCEYLSMIARFIGELLLQVAIYGMLCAQRIFLHILGAFAPLMFAISLSPHFKSAWSQWLGKYVSVSLWGFIAYTICFYVFHIILYNLNQDESAYSTLMASIKPGDFNVAAIGMQAIGSTCMYVVGCLIGVKILGMVPEVASWCMPGGVSSSAGSAAMGVSTAAGSAVGGAIGGAAGSIAGSSVMMGAAAGGAAHRNESVINSMANQTRIGRAITNNKQ